MARIPRYEPRASMTTQSPAAKQDPSMASVEGKAMAQMGKQLGEIGAKFVEIDIFTQKNEANVKWSQQQSEILTEAANNPNIDDVNVQSEYKKRLGEAYKETLGGFSIPRARAEFQSQADLQAIGSVSKLTQFGLKTKVAKGKASIDLYNMERMNEYIAADVEQRPIIVADAHKKIDEGVQQGLYTQEEADLKKSKMVEKWDTQLEKEVKIAQRENLNGLYAEMIDLYTTKDVDPNHWEKREALVQKIGREVAAGNVDGRAANGLIRMARGRRDEQSGYEQLTFEKRKIDTYNGLLDDIEGFKGGQLEAVDIFTRTTDALDKKLITPKEAHEFVYGLTLAGNTYSINDVIEGNYDPQRLSAIQKAWQNVKMFGANAGEYLSDLTKRLAEKKQPTADDITNITGEAVRSMVRILVPGISSLPKSGGMFIDANGNKVKITPEGNVEEI